MNRRAFLRFGARAIVSVAALRAVPLDQLQRFVPSERLRDEVALLYLRRAFNKYCELGGRVPALITAGYEVFDMAEAELIRNGLSIYSYAGIPFSIIFKGVPMVRDDKHKWTVRMTPGFIMFKGTPAFFDPPADDPYPFRRDSTTF